MDFMSMSDDEIDEFLVSRQEEMDASDIERGKIHAAAESGESVIERRPYGVAVVNPMVPPPNFRAPCIWLLYVAPEHRGQGNGRRFVRELIDKYATTHFMKVYAYGTRRTEFYFSLGFQEIERDDSTGLHIMSEWDNDAY